MPEPRSHFQLSFTTRQAMVLFVGLLLALGIAYFLGVMTGMAGRESAAAAVTPAPEPEPTVPPAAASAPNPTPESNRAALAPVTFPKPVLGTEPTTPPTLQMFDDRGGEEPTPAKRAAKATPVAVPPAPAAGELWVQVFSVSSEKEARSAKQRLMKHGHHVSVSPAAGPKGTVYRVRVGPFPTRDLAAKAAEQISREEKVQTWIVPAGK
ncbi:MAG TPA: SPOR domain-containing protein [Thermoanaerobaculia bacterium]